MVEVPDPAANQWSRFLLQSQIVCWRELIRGDVGPGSTAPSLTSGPVRTVAWIEQACNAGRASYRVGRAEFTCQSYRRSMQSTRRHFAVPRSHAAQGAKV